MRMKTKWRAEEIRKGNEMRAQVWQFDIRRKRGVLKVPQPGHAGLGAI